MPAKAIMGPVAVFLAAASMALAVASTILPAAALPPPRKTDCCISFSRFSSASVASSQMGGIDYYLFLKRLLANWDRRLPALQEILPNLADRIFTADEVTVSFTGPA